MQILINNQLAAIKQGSSFDFVSENRFFSGADGYTLAITFPLKDCQQNLAIFGHINRKDVVSEHLLFDCEIRDKDFVIYGSITITEISEVEVKCQFLEGRSVQNYDVTFNEVYINELELGYPDTSREGMSCDFPYIRDNRFANCNYLALPWVNNNTGNIQNKWKAHHTLWADRVQGLSYQPYMWYIVGLIFENIGFTHNFLTEWKHHYKWGSLLCCNTLPYAWGIRNWARALPHWTLSELIEQLEMLMNCEFEVDMTAKSITISFNNVFLTSGRVNIEKVVDEFSETIVEASDNKYKGLLQVRYTDCDHRMWKYMVCPQAVTKMYSLNTMYTRVTYATAADMVSALISGYISINNYNMTNLPFNRLYHIADVDMNFALRVYNRKATWMSSGGYYLFQMDCVPQSINAFGSPSTDSAQELKIVPCWLDEVINENKGVKRLMLFLDCPDMQIEDGQNDADESTFDAEENKNFFMSDFNSMPCYYAAKEDTNEKQEFFDKIYVGFWATYANGRYNYTDGDETDFARWPFPVRDSVEIDLDWTVYQNEEFTLRIGNGTDEVNTHKYFPTIDPTRKYTIKFLADSIPNPRAKFFIHGKQYICEKLTATFTENGMSQLIKGEFYQVAD